MRNRFIVLAIVFGAAGCGGIRSLADLNSPDQLTLYSIDGRDEQVRRDVKGAEKFHGYPILGKVEIADLGQRKQIVTALKQAYARRPTEGAKCFWPRHGIRAVENGKSIEFVICFECSWFSEFVGETRQRHETIDSNAQPTFDKPLFDAGVPIAPK